MDHSQLMKVLSGHGRDLERVFSSSAHSTVCSILFTHKKKEKKKVNGGRKLFDTI